MAAEVQAKIEEHTQQDFASQYAGATRPTTSAAPMSTKAKLHGLDKDLPGGAKRRCVSTACVACRKRKSKVGAAASQVARWMPRETHSLTLTVSHSSVTATRLAALHAPPSTIPNASTIPIRTTAARAFTKKILIISKPAILLYRL